MNIISHKIIHNWIQENLEFPLKDKAVFESGPFGGLTATITVPSSVDVPHTTMKGELIKVYGHTKMYTNEHGFVLESELIRAVFHLVASFSFHEFCENFRVKGDMPFDPHRHTILDRKMNNALKEAYDHISFQEK